MELVCACTGCNGEKCRAGKEEAAENGECGHPLKQTETAHQNQRCKHCVCHEPECWGPYTGQLDKCPHGGRIDAVKVITLEATMVKSCQQPYRPAARDAARNAAAAGDAAAASSTARDPIAAATAPFE